MNKRLVSTSMLLILLISAIPLILDIKPVNSEGGSETIKVSQAKQLTTNPKFDRNPSFLKTTGGTWFVFFARGRGDPSAPGYYPDTDYYDICYVKSTDNGLTWTEATLPSIPDGHGLGAFTIAALQDDGGKLWVFYAANGVGIFYFTSTDNGATWTGPTAVPNVGGFTVWNHMDAIKANDGTIWVFYHGDPGSAIFTRKFDGISWSSPIIVDDSLDYTATPRALQEADNTFRVVYIAGDPLQIYMASSADGINWYQSSIINTANDDYDPMLVKDGSTWRLFFAPYIPADDHQWLMTSYSTDLSTWASPLMVTVGKCGANKWWDFYPEAVVPSSELVLFYASMKDGNKRGDGEIYMFNVDWDLTKDHYDFIQPAIDAASAGDTILVQAGTYPETITINKGLTITGDPGDASPGPGPNAPILDGSTVGNAVPAVTITQGVSNVVFEGFEIRNYGTTSNTNEDGISVWNSGTFNIQINDNYIHHVGYDGILVGNGWGGPQGLHNRWTITRNIIQKFGAYAVDLENAEDSRITDNEISDPTYTTTYGIVVTSLACGTNSIDMSNVTVSGNKIISYPDCAMTILAWTSDAGATSTLRDVKVIGNTITGNSRAILAWKVGSGTNTLRDLTITDNNITINNPKSQAYIVDLADAAGTNTFENNNLTLTGVIGGGGTFFHGINIVGSSTGTWTISDNKLNGNNVGTASCGFRLRGTLPSTAVLDLTRNSITGFASGIRSDALATGTQVTVHYNNIAGNSQYGVFNGAGETIDARFNWWGDASGPYHATTNPSGLGDDITDYVDYSPWLGFVVGTSPMTWHVNPTGTIQEAIDEAASGDTIIVHDGTYNEALYIYSKSLTIKAASNPVIQGSQLVTTNYGDREAVIFVENAANVVLEGLDIEGLGFGYGLPKSYGVIYEESTGIVRKCIVSTNLIGDMYDIGIAAWDNSSLTVSSCTVRNFGRIGIFYYDGCSRGVYDSRIEGQVYNDENYVNYGIEIETWSYQCNIEIIGNEIYNCDNTNPSPSWSSAGIVIDGWRASYDLPMSAVEILNNHIHDNYYGIEVVANSLSYARCNSITKNREYGIIQDPDYADNNVPFDAILNWWGDYSGPYHNTSWTYMGVPYGPNLGLGDRVSDYVLYVPWVGVHDIAVANVVEPPIVFRGGHFGYARIHATVINEGTWTETFDVTVSAIDPEGATIDLGTQTVTNLAPLGHVTLTFLWETAGWTIGNYTIKAYASPVTGEVPSLQGDNTCYSDGKAMLMLLGDLGGPVNYVPTFFKIDGKVDAYDLALFIACYKGLGP